MARTSPATDPRDVPQCLRAVRLNPWLDAPTENGASVCYGTFENGSARSGTARSNDDQRRTR